MFGNPCKHVWTYAVGATAYTEFNCPCAKVPGLDGTYKTFLC